MSKKGGPDVSKLKQMFKETDKNGDGFVDIMEFRNLMKRGECSITDSQIADTFVFFDGPKGDKRISFDEFEAGLRQILEFVERVKQLFKQMDTSGDGFLDQNELRTLLERSGQKYEPSEVTQILRKADVNGDNKISLCEFLAAVS